MTLRKPAKLSHGSHVRIISPSGPVREEHVRPAIEVLASWGLRVSVDDAALAASGYLAGNDAARTRQLADALGDDQVDMVLCSRGGYGAMRILPNIAWDAFAKRPKILAGFSDITALHLAAGAAGAATLHGHVAKSFASQAEDLEAFRQTLFGERGRVEIDVTPVRLDRDDVVTGPLFGGNLSVLAALAGTPYLPSLDGAVLFLEDVTEPDYRIDRLLTSLRLNPKFRGVAAVILGGFDQCDGVYVSEAQMPDFLAELGHELSVAWDAPVVLDFPSGHGRRNVPLPFGVPVTVDAARGIITLDEELTR